MGIWDKFQDIFSSIKNKEPPQGAPKQPGPVVGQTPGGPIRAPSSGLSMPPAPGPGIQGRFQDIMDAHYGKDAEIAPPGPGPGGDPLTGEVDAKYALSLARGLNSQVRRGELDAAEALRILDLKIPTVPKGDDSTLAQLESFRNTFGLMAGHPSTLMRDAKARLTKRMQATNQNVHPMDPAKGNKQRRDAQIKKMAAPGAKEELARRGIELRNSGGLKTGDPGQVARARQMFEMDPDVSNPFHEDDPSWTAFEEMRLARKNPNAGPPVKLSQIQGDVGAFREAQRLPPIERATWELSVAKTTNERAFAQASLLRAYKAAGETTRANALELSMRLNTERYYNPKVLKDKGLMYGLAANGVRIREKDIRPGYNHFNFEITNEKGKRIGEVTAQIEPYPPYKLTIGRAATDKPGTMNAVQVKDITNQLLAVFHRSGTSETEALPQGVVSLQKKLMLGLGVAGAGATAAGLAQPDEAQAGEAPAGTDINAAWASGDEAGARAPGGQEAKGFQATASEMGEAGAAQSMKGLRTLEGKEKPDEPFSSFEGFDEEQKNILRSGLKKLIGKKEGEELTDAEKRAWSGTIDMLLGAGESLGAVPYAAVKKLMDTINPGSKDNSGLAQFVLSVLPLGALGKEGKGAKLGEHLKDIGKDEAGAIRAPGLGAGRAGAGATGGRGGPPGAGAPPGGGPPGGGPTGGAPGAPAGRPAAPPPRRSPLWQAAYRAASHNVRGLISPGTASPAAAHAAGVIRQKTGIAARFEAISRNAFHENPTATWFENNFMGKNYERMVHDLGPRAKLGLLDYMEGRSTGITIPDPEFQAVADEIREAMINRRDRLHMTDKHDQMAYIDDYVGHYWDDPVKAEKFRQWWMAEGPKGTAAAGHTRKRSIPTISDGISYGLKPVTTNVIDLSLRYIQQMDRYLAHVEIMEKLERDGMWKWLPENSLAMPPGWTRVSGKYTTRGGQNAVAPADVARVYSRFASNGAKGEYWKPIAEGMIHASNMVTAWKLGLSAFHGTVMSMEAPISAMSIAIGQATGAGMAAARRDFRGALKLLGGSAKNAGEAMIPVAAGLGLGAIGGPAAGLAGLLLSGGLVRAARGQKGTRIYLGRSPGSSLADRRLVNILTEAGGRFVGKKHAMEELEFSPMGSFFTQWKRMGTKGYIQSSGRRLGVKRRVGGRDIGALRYAVNTPGEMFHQLGVAFETASSPLFEIYIPRLKVGAAMANLQAWIEANPGASHEATLVAARKIVDSIDNRFGEMVQDNIFWSKGAKQWAMFMMTSYSWAMGTFREIGGGALAGIGRAEFRNIDITRGEHYDPRMGYVIALPVITAIMGSVYTYLKTGEKPTPDDYSPKGLVNYLLKGWNPKTGGKVPGPGGRNMVEEKAQLPSYMRDVMGWYYDWLQEAENKIATLPRTGAQAITGVDWRSDPIVHTWNPRLDQRMGDWISYLFLGNDPQFGPISVNNYRKGEKRGSNISVIEQLMGVRPASMWIEAPKETEQARHHRFDTEQKKWKKYNIRQKNVYRRDSGGTGMEVRKPNFGGPQE